MAELKRNLIFLEMLDKIRCIVKLEYNALRVMKKSIVLMKGDVNTGIYVLQRTALT